MAVFGFYSSVRLDLPLGPTDVTLGCLPDFPRLRAAPIFVQAGAGVDLSKFFCAVELRVQHDNTCGAVNRRRKR